MGKVPRPAEDARDRARCHAVDVQLSPHYALQRSNASHRNASGWENTVAEDPSNRDSSIVVRVEQLRKVFRKHWTRKRTVAVDDVSFQVRRGEVFGFLGPNGAGKTTTMKMLMGLLHPTSGRATLLDMPMGAREAKRRVGYLPENPYFYDYLSANEFLHMVGRVFGMDRATRIQRAGALLEQVGLDMAKDRAMRSYSKGMLQRVGLAQALMSDPELVVLDEPMSGLDPIGRREVRDMILNLRRQGKTVFFCTHILADAEQLCDRVAIIVKGKIRETGLMSELLGQSVHRIDLEWRADQTSAQKIGETLGDGHRAAGDVWHYAAHAEDDATRAVEAIIHGGGQILAVTPHRQTLEEIFVRDASGPAGELRS